MLEHPEGFEDRVGDTLKVIGQSAGNYNFLTIIIIKTMANNPIQPIDPGVYLKPGEQISEDFLTRLQEINQCYTDSKDFPAYRQDLQDLFKTSIPQINHDRTIYLAGFVEGEGSLNIGAKKNTTSRFKLYIDPEFSITQHINGIANLLLALSYFQTGRIRHKPGSNATMVYTIDNRVSLEEKVVPFYENHVCSIINLPVKQRRVQIFKKLLALFKEGAHLDLNTMVNDILPLWDSMRMQKGQSNQSFRDLQDAQEHVLKAAKEYDAKPPNQKRRTK